MVCIYDAIGIVLMALEAHFVLWDEAGDADMDWWLWQWMLMMVVLIMTFEDDDDGDDAEDEKVTKYVRTRRQNT